MEIRRRFAGDVAILELSGRFAVSPEETEVFPLRAAVTDLIAQGRVCIALHLAGLAATDARGLGELVFLSATLRRHGGELTLIAPTARVRHLLGVTRLDRVMAICSGEQEAIAGLSQARHLQAASGHLR